MQYEHFSRKKYSTGLHVADRLKQNNPSAISYLNQLACDKQKSIEKKKVVEPYLNECILATERMKNNRRSERDRQICYENLILAQKLERIKKQSGQNARKNLEKDYRNHARVLTSKANCEQNAVQSMNKKFITKQSLLTNEKRFSETTISSYHSPSPIQSDSEVSSSEDDQATAADVDASMEYWDSRSAILCKQRNNRNFNCAPSMARKNKKIYSLKNQNHRSFEAENDRIYQHLSNIDMSMMRDAIPLPTSQNSKHFSICILPHFDCDVMKPMNNHSKVLARNRHCAFKKEILYD
jgi:hypothetical protein